MIIKLASYCGGFFIFLHFFYFFIPDFTGGPAGYNWGTTKSWTCDDLLSIVSLPCNDEYLDLEKFPSNGLQRTNVER
ncbi:hypothetical protein [Flavobacterium laiguense]|uniref:Uncharacterized protein n=1 Tax=Flavobacterium laiguense TaxID=2169409 RepID=A0A2U1JZR9_9FLAO|nr:hypothetical protein [Flavobacterium laiguense]PWA10485.1 hypothetical protein DB891_04445 [Flavobacterium laiguense]